MKTYKTSTAVQLYKLLGAGVLLGALFIIPIDGTNTAPVLLLTVIPAGVLLVDFWLNIGREVTVSDAGLRLRERGKESFFPWEQVTGVSILKNDSNGQLLLKDVYGYRLYHDDTLLFSISYNLEDFHELGTEIERHTLPLLLRQYWRQYQRDEPIVFTYHAIFHTVTFNRRTYGDLMLNQQGVRQKERSALWKAIRDIKIGDTLLRGGDYWLVDARGGSVLTIFGSYKLTNTHVIVPLIQRVIAYETQTAVPAAGRAAPRSPSL